MRFETTVLRPVETSGVGLHSGAPVRIRIVPAPPSTGIVFLRTDLDNFAIPASWRHVVRVSYATSLMRQSVWISTTEHLLSVFYSMGIDNVYVEIDNLEVPILDGSGLPFAFTGTYNQAVTEYGLQVANRINFADGRIKPTLSVDVSAGLELYKKEKHSLRLQGDVADLNNRLNVIDFGGLFSGNAIGPPRSYSVRLAATF